MIRNIYCYLALFLAALVSLPAPAQDQLSAEASAPDQLSAEDWQEDLRFLQKTVHQDYPFLFKKTTAAKFDAAVEKLHGEIPRLETHQIVIGLARIVSSFEYGHTTVSLRNSQMSLNRVPWNLYRFKDGIYVEGVHKDYEPVLGAKLVEVEGVPVEKALAAIRPVVPAENEQYFKGYGLVYLGFQEVLHAQGVIKDLDGKITFTFEKNDKTFQHEMRVGSQRIPARYGFTMAADTDTWLTARKPGELPLYLKSLNKIYFFEYLPESKTVYVRQSQVQDDPSEDIPTFYRRVFDFVEANDVEKLVIDVRLNGGGNNYKNKAVITGLIETKKINQKGKLFVIIGRRTFSACQNLVNELDNYTNAIFVGEPTSENVNFYGDNRRVILPNSKIPVFLSFAWWQDKPQWENGPWTAPHLAVDMTFDEYRTNRDPALETVLRFDDANFIRDPLAYFRGLFEKGEMARLETEARRLVKDPRYRYYDFEGQINQAGYNLLQGGRAKEALYVFKMNNELFPESANSWDSLGEALLKTGERAKAIACYEKALSLDPQGPVGDNARKMLQQIKNK